MHPPLLALLVLATSSPVLAGCRKTGPQGAADASAAFAAEADGESPTAAADAALDDGAATPPAMLHATAFITPVMSEPAWAPRDPPKAGDDRKVAVRLGYLRKGAAVAVQAGTVQRPSCAEGWYELVAPPDAPGATGGFVCGKHATLDADAKDLASAPHAPNMAGPLPYDYGLNLVNGAPLYRRAPLRAERNDYERGLAEGAWNLAHKDKSQISMEDLKGETGLIEQRMVKGFYLAIDQELDVFSGKLWRTTRGLFVPKDYVLVHETKVEFEGVWLSAPGETRHLPLGWVTNPHAHRYTVDEAGVHRGERVARFTIVQLTGKKQVIDHKVYDETEEGWWMRDVEGAVTAPGPPPKELAAGERWIDVNLGRQSLVAFEGDRPAFATIVSTGRRDDDPGKDHRTRPGEFRVVEKHVSATMDANTASDGPYSIEDVPWVMYFDGSTALHGAFWHSRFGHERSHGCVNMTPHDARELFGWVGPRLPDAWHGVHSTDANPGTRVMVHYDGQSAAESRRRWEESRDAGAAPPTEP
jgi:hypothetical protein